METKQPTAGLNPRRRRFLGTAAVALAAAQLGWSGRAQAQSGAAKPAEVPAIKPGTNTSFAPLKQIDAGVLNVGYAEAGPAEWPARHSAARLALRHSQLCRCRAAAGVSRLPRDRSVSARLWHHALSLQRHASATASRRRSPIDIIDLMDALKIEKATLAGFDWGARTANIVAALWPERCKAMVSVSGYLIGSQEAGKVPLPPKAELQWWYQYLFRHRARPRRLRQIPAGFCQADLADRLAEVEFRRRDVRSQRGGIRQSGSRRHRRSTIIAGGSALPRARRNMMISRSDWPQFPAITVPTITLEGDANGAPHPEPASTPEILRQIRAPDHRRRHRPQSAAGSAAGVCPGGHRRRSPVGRIRSGEAVIRRYGERSGGLRFR